MDSGVSIVNAGSDIVAYLHGKLRCRKNMRLHRSEQPAQEGGLAGACSQLHLKRRRAPNLPRLRPRRQRLQLVRDPRVDMSSATGTETNGPSTCRGRDNQPTLRRLTRARNTGHAGILIECEAGSILCDPWFEPAFLGSWFVPRNDQLDAELLIASNMLIISMCRTWVTTTTRTACVTLERDIPILRTIQHLNNNASSNDSAFRSSSTLLMVRSRCYVTVSPLRFT